MANTETTLTDTRKDAIREALVRWYESYGASKDAAKLLDLSANQLWGLRTGLRPVPPKQLAILYKETGNDVFLFTKEERERYRRLQPHKPLPNEEEWPLTVESPVRTATPQQTNLEKVRSKKLDDPTKEELSSAIEIAADISNLFLQIAALPAKHPIREAARKDSRLVKTAMGLYQAIVMTGLEFPEAFDDLRKQLETARVFSS